MFDEPPYAERHVRWCEGTGNQIMITFLLDVLSGRRQVSLDEDGYESALTVIRYTANAQETHTKRGPGVGQVCVRCGFDVRLTQSCLVRVLSVYNYTCLGMNSDLIIQNDSLILS